MGEKIQRPVGSLVISDLEGEQKGLKSLVSFFEKNPGDLTPEIVKTIVNIYQSLEERINYAKAGVDATASAMNLDQS